MHQILRRNHACTGNYRYSQVIAISSVDSPGLPVFIWGGCSTAIKLVPGIQTATSDGLGSRLAASQVFGLPLLPLSEALRFRGD